MKCNHKTVGEVKACAVCNRRRGVSGYIATTNYGDSDAVPASLFNIIDSTPSTPETYSGGGGESSGAGASADYGSSGSSDSSSSSSSYDSGSSGGSFSGTC